MLDSVFQSVWTGKYYDPLASISWNVRRAAVDLKEVAQKVGVETIAAMADACLERLDSADEQQKDASETVEDPERSDST